jgi:hypothetical protein
VKKLNLTKKTKVEICYSTIPNSIESENPPYWLHNEYVKTWKSFLRCSNFIFGIDEPIIIMGANLLRCTKILS